MPLRILIVSGMPTGFAASTACSTMRPNSLRRQGSAEPPPRRVTLGTGQPKLRSMWSASPSSADHAAPRPAVTSGSTP